ncbi:MAG: hypothetical protein MUO99_04405 [Dehalococcoidales bacterium]|nr:hypothetical protein [Dehalococcoidales bacterium]
MIQNIKPKPEKCWNCGSTEFWLREASQWGPGAWLCCRCHPNPNKEVKDALAKRGC